MALYDQWTADDFRTAIDKIDKILASGAAAVSIAGGQVQIDRESLRKERRRLVEMYEHYYGGSLKPPLSTLDLSRVAE